MIDVLLQEAGLLAQKSRLFECKTGIPVPLLRACLTLALLR
jgi:hypothetical protein